MSIQSMLEEAESFLPGPEARKALSAAQKKIAELEAKLFPYANATEVCGMSWNGFYLIGDSKSIDELKRIEHRAAQLEQFQKAFEERVTAERQRREEAERTGIERAAKWHEEQARKTMIAHKILFHQNSAADIRKIAISATVTPLSAARRSKARYPNASDSEERGG